MTKTCDTYTHIIQPLKKKGIHEILPFVTTWIYLEGIMLSEISMRNMVTVSFTCGI